MLENLLEDKHQQNGPLAERLQDKKRKRERIYRKGESDDSPDIPDRCVRGMGDRGTGGGGDIRQSRPPFGGLSMEARRTVLAEWYVHLAEWRA